MTGDSRVGLGAGGRWPEYTGLDVVMVREGKSLRCTLFQSEIVVATPELTAAS